MSFVVRVTPEAQASISDHARWWADHHSVAEAMVWFEVAFQRLDALSEMPRRHPLARENEKATEELRELRFGIGKSLTHRAIFWLHDDIAEVLTVRHVAQDEWSPIE